jgi:hypothetical protein
MAYRGKHGNYGTWFWRSWMGVWETVDRLVHGR